MSKLTLQQFNVIEALLNSVGLGIVVTDTSGKLLFFNSAATNIIGVGADRTAPEDWPRQYGIYLPDGTTLCPDAQSPLVRAIGGEEADNVEVLVVTSDRDILGRWCSINLRPLKNEHGDIEGAILLIQDMTERKKLADEVARSNADLQQFAAVAAHDLQEPLRSIAGFQDLLAQHLGEELDEKSVRCMGKMKAGIKRMQTLINDLLSYSRIQNKPKLLTHINCNELIETCIESLTANIRDSGGKVTFDHLPTILADAAQLSQLVQNLLGNALKFASSDRPLVVNISAKRQGIDWLFSVTDNGIGIAPEFADRIFVLFQRLHTTAAYPGTGIGLAICKRIVENHAGRIWLTSIPDRGSTFYFTIRGPVLEEVR